MRRYLSSIGPIELTLLFTAYIAATYGFGVYLFASLMPQMRGALGFSYATAGGMAALAQAGLLVCAALSAAWVQRFGAERVVLGSVLVCCASLGAMGAVQSTWQVAALLLAMGGAAAAVWVPMVAVVQRYIAPAHRGKVLGLISSGTAYGVMLNGIAISHWMPAHSWRSVWGLLAVPTALLLGWGALRLLGAATPGTPGQAQALDPIALTPVRSAQALWRLPVVAKVLALMLLAGVACMPMQSMLSAFLVDELGYDPAQAGWAWTVLGGAGMAGGICMGALADRIGPRRSLALTFAGMALAAAAFAWHGSTWAIVGAAAVFGFAFNATFGLVPAYIGQHFASAEATRVFGYATVMLGLGSMLGNAASGLLRDWAHSFTPIYLLALLLCVLLVWITLALPKVPGDAGHA